MGNKDKKEDVLFWANINPNKRGSFEDYICHLASLCKGNGVKIKFILGNEVNDCLKVLFERFAVDFIPLSSKELNSVRAMAKILKDFKPKIVHFNFIGLASPLILLCKIIGIDKVVVTDHKSTSLSANYLGDGSVFEAFKRLRRRFYLKRVDYFVGVSKFVGDRLLKTGIPAGKVIIIYNGVDLNRFCPPSDEVEKGNLKRDFFNVDRTVPVVTYIGQLTEEKGLIVYLESVRKLLTVHDDILFDFVGAGPLESHLIHYIEQAKNKMIRFLGLRDDAELILKASDIVVVPSVWEEAFGLVIAEALACGVPVVGSRIGGIPEVLSDQQTGILTTPGDADELSREIERLAYDRRLSDYFSENGRKHVEENFDIGMQASKTLELYQRCLKT